MKKIKYEFKKIVLIISIMGILFLVSCSNDKINDAEFEDEKQIQLLSENELSNLGYPIQISRSLEEQCPENFIDSFPELGEGINQKIIECKNSLDKDECLAYDSPKINSNPRLCEHKTFDCLESLAKEYKDHCLCKDSIYKSNCYYAVATEVRDPEYCNFLDEENEQGFSKNDCIFAIAWLTGNVELCEGLDDTEKTIGVKKSPNSIFSKKMTEKQACIRLAGETNEILKEIN